MCITTRFCGKNFCLKNWGNGPKMAKNRVFFNLNLKFGHWFSLYLFYIENFYLLCSCTNPLGKIWDTGQNPLSQSDCRISKWTVSPEQIDEAVNFSMLIWPTWSLDSKIELTNGINLFFAYWYNFMKINVKVLGVGMVKNGCGQSCYRTVSEKWTGEINWFFACFDTDSQKLKAD